MQQIHIPRANTNDDTCVLLEWLYEDGAEIQDESVVAYMETSKANIDVLSPGAGILHRLGKQGEEYATGSSIGYLFASREERAAFLANETDPTTSQTSAFILTRDAQELVTSQHITETQLRSLGKKLLRKDDILTLLNATPPEGRPDQPPQRSRNQTIIARRVTLAHQTIPSAFAAMKIYCDSVLQALAAYIEKNDLVIGLAEVLVKELAEMQRLYPGFYQDREPGTEGEPDRVENPNIGITMDVGTGLYIPVLKSVLDKSLGDIADEMMEFRMKALRRTFKEEELNGGHLTLSLHTGQDITIAMPIIFPTQTCILSLCSVQEELYLDQTGSVSVRHYFNLGLTYDHRTINGAEAINFLQEIKSRLEALEELDEQPGIRKAEDAL
jgi:2-oxoglutarate dehydrogenase E2 component (dihydrolipoamide succinyltransferase)